jgi:hypothetical protein
LNGLIDLIEIFQINQSKRGLKSPIFNQSLQVLQFCQGLIDLIELLQFNPEILNAKLSSIHSSLEAEID